MEFESGILEPEEKNMIKSNLYKITTGICVLLLAAATIFVLMRWGQLPDQVAVHYNFAGEADGYGGKGTLLLLMVLAWVVFFVMTISIRFPDKWNMPVKVTAENKARLYAITRAMMEALKVLTTLLFVLLFTTAAAGVPIPQWAMLTLLAAILLTVIAGFILMYKNR